jgi:UDP-glucose 4-epimerase
MRVLITGGTGFVDAHTVAAVVRAGHAVCLLFVHRKGSARRSLRSGSTKRDTVTGDVLDAASVQAAVDGCEAIINAAAVYSLDPGEAKKALATNACATEICSKRPWERDSIRSSTCQAGWPFYQAMRCSDRTVRSVWGHPPTRGRRPSLS